MREAKEGRDRAFVLARLVREADRRFRDENQPELLLRASRFLSEVTRGRYDRIELGDPGDESFYLREPSGTRTRKVGESLSQGDQGAGLPRVAACDHQPPRRRSRARPRSSWTRRWSTGTPGGATAPSESSSGSLQSVRSSSSPVTLQWRARDGGPGGQGHSAGGGLAVQHGSRPAGCPDETPRARTLSPSAVASRFIVPHFSPGIRSTVPPFKGQGNR